MTPQIHRCRRCKTAQPHATLGEGARPGTTRLRCGSCGLQHERGLRHAVLGGVTRCGLPLGGALLVAAREAQVSCAACARELRVFLPVQLPPVRAHCERCRAPTEQRAYPVLDHHGREGLLLRCSGCGAERRGKPLLHQAAEGATACGLALDRAERHLAPEALAVTCAACREARGVVELEPPVEGETRQFCPGCRRQRLRSVGAWVRNGREEIVARCPGCGYSAAAEPVRHLGAEGGLTLCGLSLSRRFVTARPGPGSACRACVLAAASAALGGTPDWRPEVPIAEDYLAV